MRSGFFIGGHLDRHSFFIGVKKSDIMRLRESFSLIVLWMLNDFGA
jgi:hypothetical protein